MTKTVCNRFPNWFVSQNPDGLLLFDIRQSLPVKVSSSVEIKNTFQVTAFHGNSNVFVHDLLGFSHELTRWSQLEGILHRVRTSEQNLNSEIFASLNDLRTMFDDLPENIMFLFDQLRLCTVPNNGRRYPVQLIHHAVNLFLSSRNAYRTLSGLLSLPCPKTLKNFLGRIGEVGTHSECEMTVASVFENLSPRQRKCLIIFDEIYVRPSIRFRSQHLIGYSVDEPSKPARTILALMVKPLFGAPAFTAR